jgi:Ca2+-transporting ATPase
VTAIEQGRTIHTNIGKSLRFLLATNVSEILLTLSSFALGIRHPMSAMQFLWINLLSDVAPALALAVEPAEADVMTQPPRDPRAPLLPRAAMIEIGRDASILTATALAAHGIALARYGAGARATSVAFSTLTTGQLLHALGYRSRAAGAGGLLLGTVALSIGAQLGAMALPPLRAVLGLTPLGMADWGLVLGGATLPLLVGEMARRGRAIDTRTEALPSQGGRDGSDQETDIEGTGARAEPTR